MVKIPSLDELKKMGSGLIDQAKTVKFGEMVDKVKSGIDSISSKKAPIAGVADNDLKSIFQSIYATLNEMTQAQNAQLNAVKKVETQLEQLAKLIETYQKPAVPAATENKDDEGSKT